MNVPGLSFSPSAYVRVDAAVFVVRGVPFAFFGAAAAGDHACLDCGPDHSKIDLRTAGQDGHGRGADVRAIKAGTDALDQPSHVRFGHAGVSTSDAGLETGQAFLDAVQKLFIERQRPDLV
jgi:hypothetical protein